MFEYRTENLRRMDALHYLAWERGLSILSFHQEDDGKWCVSYFDPSRWLEPQRPFLGTDTLYELQMKDYIHRCTVQSKFYSTFEDLITGEIQRLKDKL